MEKLVNNRDIVVPGQALASGEASPGDGTYLEGGNILSEYVGTVEFRDGEVRVSPRRGRYVPE
ncbi:MAG: hypothetical protein ABEI52_01720, partial [Halobacteriaceae archaeon]